MEDLPLEVAEIHGVKIHHPDRSHPRRGQVECEGRTQAARTDQQDLRGLDLLLAGHADLGENEVPAVSSNFFIGEFHAVYSCLSAICAYASGRSVMQEKW